MNSAEEYLKSLIGSEMDKFGKGEFMATLRARLRMLPEDL